MMTLMKSSISRNSSSSWQICSSIYKFFSLKYLIYVNTHAQVTQRWCCSVSKSVDVYIIIIQCTIHFWRGKL